MTTMSNEHTIDPDEQPRLDLEADMTDARKVLSEWHADDHALYTRNTWAATPELQNLRDGEFLTPANVVDLYAAYLDGCESAGSTPTMCDFGAWLAGLGDYEGDVLPAEVVW